MHSSFMGSHAVSTGETGTLGNRVWAQVSVQITQAQKNTKKPQNKFVFSSWGRDCSHLQAQAAISICFAGEKEQWILQSKGQVQQLGCRGCGSCLTARPRGQCRRLPALHKYCMSWGEGPLRPPSAPALPHPSPLCILLDTPATLFTDVTVRKITLVTKGMGMKTAQ